MPAGREAQPVSPEDKVLRLLVPLLVGVFTFSVTQVYVERVSHGQFQGTLLRIPATLL